MAWAQVRRPAPDRPVMMTVRGCFGRLGANVWFTPQLLPR